MGRQNNDTNSYNKDSGLVKFRPMNEIISENREKRKIRYNNLVKKMEEILRGNKK
ncbi:hypothetical protein MACH08_41520 [Oceanobacillus kimchii]|uniref:Uncharacterized protein n=1 Tax=Oceanobacillus kimchii TaxID=746691 RepID=A0ABQ5TRF8_9BACI|nr:hypothetical protein MACH08_41520 [Oceanobacillus kimchii]